MSNIEKELEENFYKKFNSLNLKFQTSEKFYIIKAFRSKMESGWIPFDLTINIGDSIIAILEIKQQSSFKSFDFTRIESYASANDIRYYVLTDGNQFIITDRKKGERNIKKNFQEFINLLTRKKHIEIEQVKKTFAEIFIKLIDRSKFKTHK